MTDISGWQAHENIARVQPHDAAEARDQARMLAFLDDPSCYDRSNLQRHFTGSALVVDPAHTCVLLTHHLKLERWLQPGGHCDGDPDIRAVALREVVEETGLTDVSLVTPVPFDLDIHRIPARRDVPEHDHHDVVFLIEADTAQPLQVARDESKGLEWVTLDDPRLTGDRRLARMIAKLRG